VANCPNLKIILLHHNILRFPINLIENVKVRLHRARAKLKDILDEACEFYYTDKNTLA
jgi:hypothetical protein